jgi:hypothetical protein
MYATEVEQQQKLVIAGALGINSSMISIEEYN